jgi:site-specific DNA-methyltransferase (adenine-specific)
MANRLYYGDNLDVLRRHVRDETVDLCYIDPPFNSKRNYNQIYNNVGGEDRALAQAFIDTWVWDDLANAGYEEIRGNEVGRFPSQLVDLVKGLRPVLKQGSLLAYLISMALRITEIRRVLKDEGSFFLHCDPTASHYLKIILDSIFCSQGGDFMNEIIWCYNVGGKSKKHFARKHDVIFWYCKGKAPFFDGTAAGLKRETGDKSFGGKIGTDENNRRYQDKLVKSSGKYYRYYLDDPKIPEDWWVDINSIQSQSAERLGYPTQKPEALLSRILLTCSKPGDTVLDAYCGCGTTVDAAQKLNRNWTGIDITYQSIAVVLKRLEDTYGKLVADSVILGGVPKDMRSAEALAHKKDDRLRKEFEKWAVLTYTSNRALINEKKGADGGIDGIAYFKTGKTDNAKIIFQVKSGGVTRKDVASLRGDMSKLDAAMAVLIVLEEPTKPMMQDAKAAGHFAHEDMGRSYDRIEIVTIKEIVEDGRRLDVPMSLDVLKAAQKASSEKQLDLL